MLMCIGGAGLFALALILLAVFLISEKKRKQRFENDYLKPDHVSAEVSETYSTYVPPEMSISSGSKTTAVLSETEAQPKAEPLTETETLPLDAKKVSSEETVLLDNSGGK